MRTTIKITLNSSSVFDGKILDYLQGRKNKAGQLKVLAYDRIVSLSGAPGGSAAVISQPQSPGPPPREAMDAGRNVESVEKTTGEQKEDELLTNKITKLGNW